MKKFSGSFLRYIPPAFLAFSLTAVYLRTMAPGLTWANGGSDGGDLIAAVATNGIPHPTGYPTYLLLAELFQTLPFHTLAYRLNLMSAIAAVGASLCIYWVVSRSTSAEADQEPNRLAGLVAGFAFGLAPMVWSQAVITEVYTLHVFFIALIFCLSGSEWTGARRKRLSGITGLALGLAVGNHVTIILMAPVFMIANAIERPVGLSSWNWSFDWKTFLRQLVFFIFGASVYLLLPWRAASNPSMNWGAPVTLDRFWWLVSGQLYQADLLAVTASEVWLRLQALASLLLQQFGFVGLAVALIGLIVFRASKRLFFFSLCQMFIYSIFAILYGTHDSYVYLLPVWVSFAIWIGWGAAGLQALFSLRISNSAWLLSVALLVYLFALAGSHLPAVDASHDLRAETFGEQVMASAPANAILFVNGDQAVFTMWYFHFVLHERPDLVIVATDLLHFDWYQGLLHSVYPSLTVPGPYPWPETLTNANPLRPVCHVEYTESALVDCSQTGFIDP